MQTTKILLNGKTVEIDLENLKDEELACRIDPETGEHYFTFGNALKAVKKQGKRLMTQEEQQWLSNQPSSWVSGMKGWVFVVPTLSDKLFAGIFLPAAGYRYNSNGTLNNRGNNGYYWSSTQNSSNGRYMYFTSSGTGTYYTSRALGFSVRCVKDIEN